jgi:hypothetical protein
MLNPAVTSAIEASLKKHVADGAVRDVLYTEITTALTNKKQHVADSDFRAIADRAFGIKPNYTARGQLLNLVGEAKANEISREYGLENIHDPHAGTRPK